MKTVIKHVYEAFDGKIFCDVNECVNYEKNSNRLLHHITENCKSTFSDDAGFDIIEFDDVESYIRTNWLIIKEIVESN